MAVSGVFKRTSQVGVREDLEDLITYVEQEETPLYALLDKTTVKNTIHEWQTDALRSPNKDNAKVEGAAAAEASTIPTVRYQNRTQIFESTYKVSGTAQAVDTAGRANEYDYQKAKALREIKRDVEAAISSANIAVADDGSTTAGQLAGIEVFIKTNVDAGAGASQGSYTNGVPGTVTDGTKRAFKESSLRKVLIAAYAQGAQPKVVIANGFNTDAATGFTGRSTPTSDGSSGTIFNYVDLYRDPFGRKLKIVPSAFVAIRHSSPGVIDTANSGRTALVLDTDLLAVGTLKGRELKDYDIGKTGDFDAGYILGEKTLIVRNELGLAKVADLTVA